MDVVPRSMGFVIVAIAAKMEQVEFIDEAVFLKEIDGAVDGDKMNFVADFLRALKDLVDVKMFFGIVHDLKNDAALAGKTNTALTKSVLQMARGVGGIDAFAGRDSMGRSGGHGEMRSLQENSKKSKNGTARPGTNHRVLQIRPKKKDRSKVRPLT